MIEFYTTVRVIGSCPGLLLMLDAGGKVGRQLIDTVRRGAAASLLIEGEAGIGKTVLVQRIAADGRSIGAASLSGAAHPFERNRPFAVVARRPSVELVVDLSA